MNTLYEKLRKRVYEIIYDGNPPLEFGCEVRTKKDSIFSGKNQILTRRIFNKFGRNNKQLFARTSSIDFTKETALHCADISEQDIIEILGKPLSLSDILRAIEKEKLSVLENIIDDVDLSLPISKQTDEVLKKLNALLV